MALPLYLAMTAAEMSLNPPLPAHPGYMACHFSPYGTGLSNCPKALPEGTMLILNDRMPIGGHDPQWIVQKLTELVERFKCSCLLLDFQRPDVEETEVLAREITSTLPCPVGVSDFYAQGLNCPVFLPPVPLDIPLKEYIAPWQGREIWLEAALDGTIITLTPKGAAAAPLPAGETFSGGHTDKELHCHYIINIEDDSARFTLYRTAEDLDALLKEAKQLGITQAVGLWQELSRQ